MKKIEAIVVPARCARTKEIYGIRAQKESGQWFFTWSFKMTETKCSKERFHESKTSGNIYFKDDYPGCPYCKDLSMVQCGNCGNVSHREDSSDWWHCPWCGSEGELKFSEDFGLGGGGF